MKINNSDDQIMKENFHDINVYIQKKTGCNLFAPLPDDLFTGGPDFSDVFTERASTKPLKVDHRLAKDAYTNHNLHIIYSLDGMILDQNNIVDLATGDSIRKPGEGDISEEEVKRLKRYGNMDHMSHHQKVLAIIDLDEVDPETGKNKTYRDAYTKAPYRSEADIVHLVVGEIDDIPSFKSTFWHPDKFMNDMTSISMRELMGRGRGVKGRNGSYSWNGDEGITIKQQLAMVYQEGQKKIQERNENEATIAKLSQEFESTTDEQRKAELQAEFAMLADKQKRLNTEIKMLEKRFRKLGNVYNMFKDSEMRESYEEGCAMFERALSSCFFENASNSLLDFNDEVEECTPQALWEWMNQNITYDDNNEDWHLKSPEELLESMKGNCHDQAYFESVILHNWGIPNGQLFFVEFSNDSEQGGNTHTLTYYYDESDESYYWFENAWKDQADIHGPYKSKSELKEAVFEACLQDKDINDRGFDGVVFGENSNYRIGMDLGDYVNSWDLDDDREFTTEEITEAVEVCDKTARDVQKIVNTLSDKEKHYIGNAEHSNTEKTIYRDIIYQDKTPVAFLELYRFPEERNTGYVCIAISKDHRGSGHARKLINNMIKLYETQRDIKYIGWLVDDDNSASIKLAKSFGFTEKSREGSEITFKLKLHYKAGAINEALEWIENFVHDDEFREAVTYDNPSTKQKVLEKYEGVDLTKPLDQPISTMDDLFEKCKSPGELFSFLRDFEYGWIDKSGKVNGTSDNDETHHLYEEYRLQSPQEFLDSGVGLCWDFAEFERAWFDHYGYPNTVVYVEIEDNDNNPTHVFLVYEDPESGDAYWFESAWRQMAGVHRYQSIAACLKDSITKTIESYNIDEGKRYIKSINKPMKPGTTCQEYYDIAHKCEDIDLDKLDDKYTLESSDHTKEKIPDVMYFSSPKKIDELKGQVFMSPSIAISSIFLVDRFNILRECAQKTYKTKNVRTNCNMGYDEWNDRTLKMKKPLSIVHMKHNIPDFDKKFSGTSEGYIYKVDVSDVKDKLHPHGKQSMDYEVIYKGETPLKILDVQHHTLKWELRFDKEEMDRTFKGSIITETTHTREGIENYFNRILLEAIDLSTAPPDAYDPNDIGEVEQAPPDMPEAIPAPTDPPADGPSDIAEPPTEDPQVIEEPTQVEETPQENPTADATPTDTDATQTDPNTVEEVPQEAAPDEIDTDKDTKPKVSDAKKADKKEKKHNGRRRKKLYKSFIEWAKSINPRNTFGNLYDKDAFTNVYTFVPPSMMYFYRVSNPMLCVVKDHITFFPLADLQKINNENKQREEYFIFAANEKEMRVLNLKNKKVFKATDNNGTLKVGAELGTSFDKYLQKLVGMKIV